MNIVTRFLNNFRIYGTPPSLGVYNDTNVSAVFIGVGAGPQYIEMRIKF